MSAASRAQRFDPKADITVFERGHYISYGACGLPYVLGGEVDDWDDLVARTPEQMQGRGIDVRMLHEVTGIDPQARTVTVTDLGAGRTFTEPYDQLLIATGVSPLYPEWAKADLANLNVLRDIHDGQRIAASLPDTGEVVIVGGGYIGLELAENLCRRGLSVVLLERGAAVARRILDQSYQGRIVDELTKHGVDVRCGVNVEALISEEGRVTGLHTSTGIVRAGAVVVATGVKANVGLLRDAGATIGATGAASVNARQQTSVDGIYAAGDNCESVHRVTKKPVHIPLGLTANRMGRVAGVNMAGGDSTFPGIVGSSIFKVFDLGVARTGLTQAEAEALGLQAVSIDLDSTDHARYYFDSQPISVRLTAEQGTGRLLGAQIIAQNHLSAKRIDVVAALLHQGSSVHDLFEMDLAYAPPFSGVWDVLLAAADKLSRKV